MKLTLVPASVYFQPSILPMDALLVTTKILDAIGAQLGGPLRAVRPVYGEILEAVDVERYRAQAFRLTFEHEGLKAALRAPAGFVTVSYLDGEVLEASEVRIDFSKSAAGEDLARLWRFILR